MAEKVDEVQANRGQQGQVLPLAPIFSGLVYY